MFYHSLIGKGETPAEDLSPVLLWENSNVSAAFAAQKINLDLTEYAGVVIEYNRKTTNQKLQTRFYMKRTDVTNDGGFYACANQTDNVSRKVSLSDTGVQFYACNDVGTGQPSNTNMIPTKIYGIKNYIVEPAVGDLLWHNDNPTATLNSKDIAGDYSKYSKIVVKGLYSTTIDIPIESVVPKDSTHSSGLLCSLVNVESSYRIVMLTDTNIAINVNRYSKDGTVTTNNNYCIITDIYGIE